MKSTLRSHRLPQAPSSCYYPRRRSWSSLAESWLCRWLRPLGIQARLEERWFLQLVLGSLIPGRAFVCRAGPGANAWPGRLLLPVWLGLGLFFVAALGQPGTTLAFFGMISIHAVSCARAWLDLLRTEGNGPRILIGLGAGLAWACLVYLPLRDRMLADYVMPLSVGGRGVVIDRRARLASARRGDLIAWRIEPKRRHGLMVAEGFGLARVLGEPGNRIRITPDEVWVNERREARAPNMPANAELVLTEKQWFAWPALSINGHWAAPSQVAAISLRLAVVDESRYVGRPFPRWFGRRQSFP